MNDRIDITVTESDLADCEPISLEGVVPRDAYQEELDRMEDEIRQDVDIDDAMYDAIPLSVLDDFEEDFGVAYGGETDEELDEMKREGFDNYEGNWGDLT